MTYFILNSEDLDFTKDTKQGPKSVEYAGKKNHIAYLSGKIISSLYEGRTSKRN